MASNLSKLAKFFDDIIFISMLWRHHRFDVSQHQPKKVEDLCCCIVLQWLKLKFGVRGNYGLLISNPSSKMQYQHKIARKRRFFLSDHIFSKAISHELVTMATNNDLF